MPTGRRLLSEPDGPSATGWIRDISTPGCTIFAETWSTSSLRKTDYGVGPLGPAGPTFPFVRPIILQGPPPPCLSRPAGRSHFLSLPGRTGPPHWLLGRVWGDHLVRPVHRCTSSYVLCISHHLGRYNIVN